MGPLGRFAAGFRYGLSGLVFLFKRRSLARYWLPPVAITALLFVLLEAAAIRWFSVLLASVWEPPVEAGCADVAWWSLTCLSWGATRALYWLAGLASWGLAAIAGLLLTFVLSALLSAPFNDALSEAVERVRGQREAPPMRLGALARDALRTLVLELGKLSLFALVMLPLFLLSWLVPGVGQLFYTVVGGLLTVTYLAVDFVDWPAARRGWPVRRRLGLLRAHTASMLGFGSCVWLLLYVPVLNLLLMPAAVIGGTLLFLDLQESAGTGRGSESARK